jgi:hypothetical protein
MDVVGKEGHAHRDREDEGGQRGLGDGGVRQLIFLQKPSQ